MDLSHQPLRKRHNLRICLFGFKGSLSLKIYAVFFFQGTEQGLSWGGETPCPGPVPLWAPEKHTADGRNPFRTTVQKPWNTE